jgi:hypothetical protein
MIEQLSVFLENETGRLARMCRVLGDAGHDMRALVVADTSEYGVARLICDHPRSARRALEDAGFAVSVTSVIAVEVPDRPGGLAGMLESLDGAGVNVEYLYCFLRPGAGTAVDILRVQEVETATRLLQESGLVLVPAASIYSPDEG